LDSQEKPEDCEGFLMKLAMDSMEELIQENSVEDSIADKALEKTNKVYDKAMELAESLERKVTAKEVAEFAGISEKAVREAMEISGYRIEVIEDDRAQ
jgi:RNA polymerase primary sigma factor